MKINNREFSENEIRKLFATSSSKQEVANLLGYSYYNGKISNVLSSLCKDLNLSMDHFDPYLSNKEKRIYPKIKKNLKNSIESILK